jgi:hypothetical protein
MRLGLVSRMVYVRSSRAHCTRPKRRAEYARKTQVAALDKKLATIRSAAKTSRAGFHAATGKIKAEGNKVQEFKAKAAKILSQVKALKNKEAAYAKLVDADSHEALMQKDEYVPAPVSFELPANVIVPPHPDVYYTLGVAFTCAHAGTTGVLTHDYACRADKDQEEVSQYYVRKDKLSKMIQVTSFPMYAHV